MRVFIVDVEELQGGDGREGKLVEHVTEGDVERLLACRARELTVTFAASCGSHSSSRKQRVGSQGELEYIREQGRREERARGRRGKWVGGLYAPLHAAERACSDRCLQLTHKPGRVINATIVKLDRYTDDYLATSPVEAGRLGSQ